MRFSQKGFTLIELLVVIAIIGLLSAVILVALNGSKSKSGDAVVKSNLDGILVMGELQVNTKGCYARNPTGEICDSTHPPVYGPQACPTTSTETFLAMTAIIKKITAATNAGGGLNSCSTSLGGQAWAVVVQYKTDLKKAWCIDSTGKKREVSNTTNYDQASINAEITAGSACVE